MRITISHNKPIQQVKDSVDHSLMQVFNGLGSGVLEIADQHHHWHGDTMAFSLTARLGFIKTPIKGTVAVTEKDVTVDVDLGLLEKLVTQDAVRTSIEGKVRGLLT